MKQAELYTSYSSRMYPLELQDTMSLYVQRVGGWLSVRYDHVVYTIPNDYAYMLYMFDPQLQRLAREDYLV